MTEHHGDTLDGPHPSCPACAAPADRGQLVCLECGSRISLSYRRPPSWKIPLAITIGILLLAGAGAVIAYRTFDDEAEREVAANPVRVKDRAAGQEDPPAGGGGDRPATAAQERAGEAKATDPAGSSPAEPGAGASTEPLKKEGELYTWPGDLEAFTVVLLSNEDRPSATAFAESVAASSSEKIGVLRSDDFESLPTGFFLVFAGRYPDRSAADTAAARLGRRFRGAFPQIVRR